MHTANFIIFSQDVPIEFIKRLTWKILKDVVFNPELSQTGELKKKLEDGSYRLKIGPSCSKQKSWNIWWKHDGFDHDVSSIGFGYL